MLSNCNRTYTIGKHMFFFNEQKCLFASSGLAAYMSGWSEKTHPKHPMIIILQSLVCQFYQFDIKRGSTKMILCTVFISFHNSLSKRI